MKLPENIDSENKRNLKGFCQAHDLWTFQLARLLEICNEDRFLFLKVAENLKILFNYISEDKLKMTEEECSYHINNFKSLKPTEGE